MIDKYDAAVLRDLKERFGVDTSPADALTGQELKAWLYQAEDALYERLQAELVAQSADRELARKELEVQYESWHKAMLNNRAM